MKNLSVTGQPEADPHNESVLNKYTAPFINRYKLHMTASPLLSEEDFNSETSIVDEAEDIQRDTYFDNRMKYLARRKNQKEEK